MEEFVIVLLIMVLCGSLVVAAVYSEDDQKHCKSMGMVKVTYSHNSYCAKLEDLKNDK